MDSLKLRLLAVCLLVFLSGCASTGIDPEPDLEYNGQEIYMSSDGGVELVEGEKVNITFDIINYDNSSINVTCRVDSPFQSNFSNSKTVHLEPDDRKTCMITFIANNVTAGKEYNVVGYVAIDNATERQVEDEEFIGATPTPTPTPTSTDLSFNSKEVQAGVSAFVLFFTAASILFYLIGVFRNRVQEDNADLSLSSIGVGLTVGTAASTLAFSEERFGNLFYERANLIEMTANVVSPWQSLLVLLICVILISAFIIVAPGDNEN